MPEEKNGNRVYREINRNKVFRAIYENGKISKQDLSCLLGMSLPTITQNLKELLEKGYIKEAGVFQSTGGRKARAVAVNDNAKYSIGIDITKNHVGIVILNFTGEIVASRRLNKSYENTKKYMEELNVFVETMRKECKIAGEKILGIGISVPGIVDEDSQMITSSYVLGIENIHTGDIASYFSYPCTFYNDANSAGTAEVHSIDGENMIYLSLSNSVGGAVFLGKKLYAGDHYQGGEFGHMTLIPEGKRCYCGKYGCVDVYCSASLLSRRTGGSLGRFFEGLKNKETEKEEIWREYIRNLAVVVHNIGMVFDCELILGGYVGSYMEDYLDELRAEVKRLDTFGNIAENIKVCRYKREAPAVGAAMEYILEFIKTV